MRINDEIVLKGIFWIPNNKENTVTGTISIRDGGKIFLDFVGQLNENIDGIFEPNSVNNIIHGEVISEGLVTIIYSHFSENTLSFGTFSGKSISTHKIKIDLLFCGYLYNSLDEIIFDEIDFSLEGTNEWIKNKLLDLNFLPIENSDNFTIRIDIKQPETIKLKLQNNLFLNINNSVNLKVKNGLNDISISQSIFYSLEPDKSHSFKYFKDLIQNLSLFFSFIFGSTINLTFCKGFSKAIQDEVKEEGRNRHLINIYYRSYPFNENKSKSYPQKLIFHYEDIKDDAELLFSNWLNIYDSFSSSFDIIFLSLLNKNLYLENKFLYLIQGLESFHRKQTNEKDINEKEYEELIQKILDSCPVSRRSWLKNKLEYTNEITLFKRIQKNSKVIRTFWLFI